jgi:hypothetical protein
MKITKLLDRLPDWRSWWSTRMLRKYQATDSQTAVSEIVRRVMGDVLDWLRTTPNAVV